jgi:hypothetical protein
MSKLLGYTAPLRPKVQIGTPRMAKFAKDVMENKWQWRLKMRFLGIWYTMKNTLASAYPFSKRNISLRRIKKRYSDSLKNM